MSYSAKIVCPFCKEQILATNRKCCNEDLLLYYAINWDFWALRKLVGCSSDGLVSGLNKLVEGGKRYAILKGLNSLEEFMKKKAKCINVKSPIEKDMQKMKKHLTVGKIYKVIDMKDYCYLIEDDTGKKNWWPYRIFEDE